MCIVFHQFNKKWKWCLCLILDFFVILENHRPIKRFSLTLAEIWGKMVTKLSAGMWGPFGPWEKNCFREGGNEALIVKSYLLNTILLSFHWSWYADTLTSWAWNWNNIALWVHPWHICILNISLFIHKVDIQHKLLKWHKHKQYKIRCRKTNVFVKIWIIWGIWSATTALFLWFSCKWPY